VPPTLSVTINTLNEEANIGECIASVTWADDIVVVDMHSDDRTVEIAASLGARTFLHERMGFADPARDFAFEQATGDWILMVDADERVPEALAEEVRRVIADPAADVYNVAEQNMVFGRWLRHGTLWPDYHPRLFRKGALSWPGQVHDRPRTAGPVVDLPAREGLALVHRSSSYESIRGFAEKYFLTYAPLEAETYQRTGYRFRRRHLLLFPWREFRLRFLTAKGYRDGFHGLAVALLHSAYRLCAVLYFWERYAPPLPPDAGHGLARFVTGLVLDRPRS
jgi:glycosyltransferase involved in cell wall biosynthesis